MSGPISKNPEGFLDVFATKQQGRYPQEVIDNIQPEYSVKALVDNFYAQQGLALLTNLTATTAPASSSISSAQWLSVGSYDFADGASNTTVPPGEIWLVEEAQIFWLLSNTAGNTGDFGLVVRRNLVTHLLTDSPLGGFTTAVAAVNLEGHRCMTRKFVMVPGDELRAAHYGVVVTAGSIIWNATVRIRRLTR